MDKIGLVQVEEENHINDLKNDILMIKTDNKNTHKLPRANIRWSAKRLKEHRECHKINHKS